MKALYLSLIIVHLCYAEHYTFLVQPYSKEVELEAKIIYEIASASLEENITLFIPNISSMEEKVYTNYFTLTQECEKANFIFINKAEEMPPCPSTKKRLFFTNNYRKLLSNKHFFGALFWNKSRPNIVFSQKRLEEKAITLPQNFHQFIESF
ncbi:hypothetical protein [Sulfurospirillum barnesii]|uniref:Uncharacterized protein n=1 Tax=Sulfurospirillum barnesii (strain ATCC 700032 / DSM 10660 / SES-3) TaxID=760154 RepID=I3XV05_SULBS|nr:hypothetical protein [Sulfurospirillum barnesii]AFL67779.1 hypothetical protein Sulba_0461 [Sulfurospirillum barnesii SES-3]